MPRRAGRGLARRTSWRTSWRTCAAGCGGGAGGGGRGGCRGLWRSREGLAAGAPVEVPRFHEFASQWFEASKLEGGARGRGLTPKGVADLEWRLTRHLLPWFVKTLGNPRLDAITVADV